MIKVQLDANKNQQISVGLAQKMSNTEFFVQKKAEKNLTKCWNAINNVLFKNGT